MTKIHSFEQYKTALDVTRDFPAIIATIDATLYELEPYKHYTDVLTLYTALLETAMFLDLELVHYNNVLLTKGED